MARLGMRRLIEDWKFCICNKSPYNTDKSTRRVTFANVDVIFFATWTVTQVASQIAKLILVIDIPIVSTM